MTLIVLISSSLSLLPFLRVCLSCDCSNHYILKMREDSINPAPIKEKHSDASSGDDVEKQVVTHMPELKRKLKSRHLQMIAIGKHWIYASGINKRLT
jgi:hypothetical protein